MMGVCFICQAKKKTLSTLWRQKFLVDITVILPLNLQVFSLKLLSKPQIRYWMNILSKPQIRYSINMLEQPKE